MSRKKTTEVFKQEVTMLTGKEYSVIGEYKGSQYHIRMRHNICGYEFDISPNNFLHGSRCHKCGGTLKKDTNVFKSEVYERVGNKYSVLSKYNGNNKKIRFIHNVCKKEFEMTPSNFMVVKTEQCPYCKKYKSHKTTEMFKEEIRLLGKGEYFLCDDYINNHTKIKFRHNCGYEFYMRPNNFILGNRCPKCQISNSKGEQRIKEILDCMEIKYISQKKFKDLLGVGGGKLSYDFYLPSHNALIEYQGAQHKRSFEFFGGEQRLKTQQIHDELKRKYADSNNIKLLEIWYTNDNKLEEILTNFINLLHREPEPSHYSINTP